MLTSTTLVKCGYEANMKNPMDSHQEIWIILSKY